MSTIKSDNSNLILNADGVGNEVKFHNNGVEVAKIDATGVSGNGSNLTSLTSGNLTGALPAIDGSALTGTSKVLQQVVNRSLTLASINTTTFTEVHSDYRVSINPISSTSRIYIQYILPVNPNGAANTIMHIQAWNFGDNSPPTSDGGNFNGNIGVRNNCTATYRPYGYDGNDSDTWVFTSYDDPGNLSLQQYGFKYRRENGGDITVYFNHSSGNVSTYGWMAPMIIIATEVEV